MVKDPRAKVRPHRLRPLASPGRLHVEAGARGQPHAVQIEGAMRRVTAIQDRWRIDDEWWRETPVARLYYELRLEEDRIVTVYQDLAGGGWWLQRY